MATPGSTTVPPGSTEASPTELTQLTQAVALLTQAVAESRSENKILREDAARREAETERRETARREQAELSKYKLQYETDEEAVARCKAPGIHWQGYITPPTGGSHFLAPYNVTGYDTSATGSYKFNLSSSSFRYHEMQWYLKLKEQDRTAEADALAEDCTTGVHLRAMHRHLDAVVTAFSTLLGANPFENGECAGATALRAGATDLLAALTEAVNSSSNGRFWKKLRQRLGETTAAVVQW